MGMQDVTTEQLQTLETEFRADRKRLHELMEHSQDELATYVGQIAVENPPGEDRPRWQVYGWSNVGIDHYRRHFSKRACIQRILTMEAHDRKRIKGERVPGVEPPQPKFLPEVSIKNAVAKPDLTAQVAAESGAGAVRRPVRPVGAEAPEEAVGGVAESAAPEATP